MDQKNPVGHAEEMSMVSGAEGKLVEEGAKLIIEHVVPKVTDYGKMLWSGRKFLVLGPPRSGKTSFLDFLEHLILEPEKSTPETVGVVKRDDKILRVGPERSLVLRVRKPRDVAGQAPIHEIQHIKDYAPHCIVVVLDATKFFGVADADSALEWLRQFCAHLDILLTSNGKLAKKLRSMIIVMNKWDRIAAEAKNDEEEYRKLYELYVRDVLDDYLHNELYSKDGIKRIEILPCALVSHTPFRDSLARQLVQTIALSLSRR